jgi:PAS domain S-box-containing protein
MKEQEERMPENFAERLLAGLPDAVIYADAEGKIQVWNEGAQRIFGFAANEAIGQTLDVIIPTNLRERHWTGFDQTMRTGESRYGAGDLLAVPAMRKDGTRISVEFTIVPFRDSSGRMEGIAAVLRDITPRFEELRTLRRQVAEAQRK